MQDRANKGLSSEYFSSLIDSARKDAVYEVRKEASERFRELGFPTKKNEEWKYTDVSPVLQLAFSGISEPVKDSWLKTDIQKEFPFISGKATLVFINGVLSSELSSVKNLPKGVELSAFSSLLSENPSLLKEYFSKTAKFEDDSLIALNTASVAEGTFVRVADNTIIEEPVCLLYLSETGSNHLLTQIRNLILVGKNSSASFIEMHGSKDSGIVFSNNVSEISIGENAEARLYKIENINKQSYLTDNTYANQAANSRFHSFAVTFSGALVRNKLNVVLAGENCETHLNGLFLTTGTNHVDNHTVMDHAKPNCYSNELYKGVLKDKSTGIFSGKIQVRKDAQKTNAFQSNKNILLSDEATVNSKPQLEIFADDVKCSHGATTGQLEPEAMFYLQSRGIGEENAKALLTFAFANEIIERISIPALKEYLETELINRFGSKDILL